MGLPEMAYLLRPVPPLLDYTRQGHFQFIWVHGFGVPGLFQATKLTHLYREAKRVNLRMVGLVR